MNYCIICKKALSGKQSKYCSRICHNKNGNAKLQNYKAQQLRALTRKRELVSLLGGECSRCGYKKNIAALDFHHTKDKEFHLDSRGLSNRNMDKILEEVSKCILLCANCHREEHHKDLN